jgi:hypothetical protein
VVVDVLANDADGYDNDTSLTAKFGRDVTQVKRLTCTDGAAGEEPVVTETHLLDGTTITLEYEHRSPPLLLASDGPGNDRCDTANVGGGIAPYLNSNDICWSWACEPQFESTGAASSLAATQLDCWGELSWVRLLDLDHKYDDPTVATFSQGDGIFNQGARFHFSFDTQLDDDAKDNLQAWVNEELGYFVHGHGHRLETLRV